MHSSVQNLINIQAKIKKRLIDLKSNKIPKIIAVSKTFGMDKISPLIEHGHIDFGKNKVQEAIEKWTEIKKINSKIKKIRFEVGKDWINNSTLNSLRFDNLEPSKLAYESYFSFRKDVNYSLNCYNRINLPSYFYAYAHINLKSNSLNIFDDYIDNYSLLDATLSTRPKSFAASGVIKLSLSNADLISSTDFPVCFE